MMKTAATPALQDAARIFSCVAFLVYSWTLLIFFWELPALMFYLDSGDILGYFAYQLTFALLESLLVSPCVAAVTLLLPSRWRSELAVTATLLTLAFAAAALVFKGLGPIARFLAAVPGLGGMIAVQMAVALWVATMLALPILAVKLAQRERVARRVNAFLESLYVLTALYAGASLLGLLVVVYRNLSWESA